MLGRQKLERLARVLLGPRDCQCLAAAEQAPGWETLRKKVNSLINDALPPIGGLGDA